MKPRAPERGTRRYFDCFTFSLTLVVPFLVVSTLAAKEPPLERLVEFNREALFGGGTVKVDKGRLALRFPEGTMRRGFRTSGKVVGELGGVPKHLREKYVKGTEKQFSCFGMSSGSASSRFEVGSDFKLSFRLRVPQLTKKSSFIVRFNQSRGKYIQTNFFRDIRVKGKAKKRQAVTPHAGFRVPVEKWFDRGQHGMLFEIFFKNGKVSVFTEVKEGKKSKRVEVVSLDGIESPTSGNISFHFSNVSFSLDNLAVDAKFPSEWVKDEIGKLRKKGKLLVKEPPKKEEKKVAKGPKGKQAKKRGKEKDKSPPAAKPKPPEVDITKPDPEIDEEL